MPRGRLRSSWALAFGPRSGRDRRRTVPRRTVPGRPVPRRAILSRRPDSAAAGGLFRGRWSLSAYFSPRSDSYRAESHIARRKRGSPQPEGVTLPGSAAGDLRFSQLYITGIIGATSHRHSAGVLPSGTSLRRRAGAPAREPRRPTLQNSARTDPGAGAVSPSRPGTERWA